MAEYQQIHLVGKGHSGLGVRYRPLTFAQVEAVEKSAAAGLTKESTVYEYNAAVVRDGLTLMVRQVTTGPMPKGALGQAQWRTLREGELAEPGAWDALFTPKDSHALKRFYEEDHSVSKAEMDEISAGKVTVVD